MVEFINVSGSESDMAALRCFFLEIYCDAFPNADERESIENMERCIVLKSAGWDGANSYNVILVRLAGRIVGGSVSDYLMLPNAGVIEFIVIAPALRRRGLATLLLERTEYQLRQDARHAGRERLDFIMAEMDDPRLAGSPESRAESRERAATWTRWGYMGLDFAYVQPSLDSTKRPVSSLLLMCKDLRSAKRPDISGAVLELFLHEYLRLAMRIENPSACEEYRRMISGIDEGGCVKLVPLPCETADSSPKQRCG